MRNFIAISAVVLLNCGAEGAQAQAPVDWSGFRVGGHVGAVQGESGTSATVLPGGTYFTGADFTQLPRAGDGSLSQWQPTGGIAGGYDKQFGRWVLGIELSANTLYFDDQRTVTQNYITQPASQFTLHQSVKADWMASVRPRIGGAFDDWLVYVTGGPAITRITLDTSIGDNFNGGMYGRNSTTVVKVGWAAGFGGEYALDRSWSLSAQYLFTTFGEVDSRTRVDNPGDGTSVLNNSAELQTHLMLLGVNYRF